MAVSSGTVDAIHAWVASTIATGRVPTRMPSGWLAGQLASRLAVANPSLGSGPAQWDYELAPFLVRVADNWQDITSEIDAQAADLGGFVTNLPANVAAGVGQTTHVLVATAADGVAAALGVPAWALWTGLAFASYYVVTHVGETKRYVKQWVV